MTNLLIVPIRDEYCRTMVMDLIERESAIIDVNWIPTESKVTDINLEHPQIGGSMKALYGYENNEIVHLVIKGEENVKRLASKIKAFDVQRNTLYVVPVLAV